MSELDILKDKAKSYFCDRPTNFPAGKPFNCCETFLKTLSEHFGIESDLIPGIGTVIGAGVSRNGLLCGCISGPALMIGIKTGRETTEEDPMKTWFLVDQYLEAFKKRFHYTSCRELTGVDVKTPEGNKKYFESIHDYACTERLKFAIGKTIELLEKDDLK
jgi:C_GCAxxG_C_C family probable redox protein